MRKYLWLFSMILLMKHLNSQLTLELEHEQQFPKLRHSHQMLSETINEHHRMTVSSLQSHSTEDYGLESSGTAFTLSLIVSGLTYKLHIDTGSSDIWIKGDQSEGAPRQKYKCPQCINTKQHYDLSYGGGDVSTYLNKLNVSLGNHTFLENVLIAYKVSSNYVSYDGLVGLSFPMLAVSPKATFIQTLINNKIIEKYAFGVNLNFQSKNRSFITLGNYDQKYFTGNLTMYQLQTYNQYLIKVDGVSFGVGPLMSIAKALLDTGNTCISIPSKYTASILNALNNNGNKCIFELEQYAPAYSQLKCKVNNFTALPDLVIKSGANRMVVPKQYYISRCASNANVWYCSMNIETIKNNAMLMLGDAFFSRFYTYFDLQEKQIGIAPNKEVITIQQIQQNQIPYSQSDWKTFN